MIDPYQDREQTGAKHFILRGYLQALAFKVLHFSDITYVDGFSGPWETRQEGFADSSFMIAIAALKDAQEKIFLATGIRRKIRCFFSEENSQAFEQLHAAVITYHKPDELFEVRTYCGKFEDAVSDIQNFIGQSFPLIFIDPTGWTGYPFDKIKLLFAGRRCEVLINFMYDFINRFVHSEDAEIIASLNPILGGPGWRDRLDKSLPKGMAVEKLFRATLRTAGNFEFVVSTKIDRATADRPHFVIAYGTKDYAGLKAFRQIEYDALRVHAKNRANAKERKRESKTGVADLFAQHDAQMHESEIDEIVAQASVNASHEVLSLLAGAGSVPFIKISAEIMQTHPLRETNVKDLLVELARAGKIENTWGGGTRKPRDVDIIKLKMS